MSINLLKQMIFQANFIKKLFLGLLIGISCITPGLSGGVIATTVGLYEPAVHAIVNLRKEFRQSAIFLFAPAIGVGAGILIFSKIMPNLMMKAEFAVLYVFLGLVAGSIPSLIKEANSGGFRSKYLWATAIAFAAVIWVGQISAWTPNPTDNVRLSEINTILYGAILGVGTIIPGISSSFILIYLGVYERLLTAISNFDIRILALLAIGFIASALLVIQLVEILFRKVRGFAYYTIIGFLFGFMVLIFPGLRTGLGLSIDIALFVAGTAVSFATTHLNQKRSC